MKNAAFVPALALLAACQPAAPTSVAPAPAVVAQGDPARGLQIADRNCSLCHAVGRDGASPHPKAPPLRTLAGRYPLESLGEAFAEGAVVGHTGMPQIQLAPQQINDLIVYLKTLPADQPR